jgi:GDP-D-mannose 3', 5'-epimerase
MTALGASKQSSRAKFTSRSILEAASLLVTINQLVDVVEEIAGIKLKRNYNLAAPKGVSGRNSDNTKIKKYLGWEPSIRLKDGMSKTYAWIESEMLVLAAR